MFGDLRISMLFVKLGLMFVVCVMLIVGLNIARVLLDWDGSGLVLFGNLLSGLS
jgi:hypothetical protein